MCMSVCYDDKGLGEHISSTRSTRKTKARAGSGVGEGKGNAILQRAVSKR